MTTFVPVRGGNRRLSVRKVTFDAWLDDNERYLLELYETIQTANVATGRRVFDRESCSFPTFCRVAYKHSLIYSVSDAWMYEEDSELEDDSHVNVDNA